LSRARSGFGDIFKMGSMKALNLGGSWLARQLKNRHSDKGDLPVLSVSPDLRKPFYLGVLG
jgi:hypothetical protein